MFFHLHLDLAISAQLTHSLTHTDRQIDSVCLKLKFHTVQAERTSTHTQAIVSLNVPLVRSARQDVVLQEQDN